MCMSNKRLPFKLLTYEWNKVKYISCPRKSWLGQVDFLRKELGLQDEALDIELIKNSSQQKSVRSTKWLYNINPNCHFIRN